ncbi:MAG TPA: zeta toxin family protein [Burkholderiales bacterium]|nr:zeta toxin family protein [Burkholderiales bacterium]
MTAPEPRIYVLAGVNGAGKSSIAGAAFRSNGADYYNPDETARALRAANPALSQADANGAAWQQGKKLLEKAIAGRLDFALETTLGANTIPALLAKAAAQGIEVHVWYAGLASPELHIERVRKRVRKGGHDIPEEDIRRRYERSRINLVHLLPKLAALRVYDNSAEADPAAGKAPAPKLVLHMEHGKILGPADLSRTPDWAKPIVAAALKLRV